MSFRLKSAILIMALLAIAFDTQLAIGNCFSEKRLYAATDDVADTIVARSGVYDPCDEYMTWADTIHCESNVGGHRLYLEYRGTSISHNYLVSVLENNETYTDGAGPVYVGPSTSHELVIRKNTFAHCDCINDIVMRVWYNAGTPGSPGH